MTIKECPNCPGRDDHDAEHCPIKPAWQIDSEGVLRNANGEWVAELVAWDKEKLVVMLGGESQPQASAAQSAPAGEREAFEAYSQSIGYTLKVGDSGRYIGGYGAELWSGFKAGAAWQRAQSAPAGAVGWQFYQDGKWWNGDDRIRDHRANTEAAGYPVRDVYAAPQPAVDENFSTTSDRYRAELYDEVWQKARDMGYGNVTEALLALERAKAQPAARQEQGDEVRRLREALEVADGHLARAQEKDDRDWARLITNNARVAIRNALSAQQMEGK